MRSPGIFCALGLLALLGTCVPLSAQEKPAQEKLDAATPESLRPRMSELDQRIENALNKKVQWNYQGTRLSEICKDLSRQAGVPITVKAQEIENTGLSPDDEINADYRDITLRSGLKLLQLEYNLHVAHAVGGLRLVGEYEGREVIRVYPVADLLNFERSADNQEVWRDYDSLIDCIYATLSPDTWTDNGGAGSITGSHGSLIVRQPPEVQREVEKLLDGLRQAKRAQSEKDEPLVIYKRDNGKLHQMLAVPESYEVQEKLNTFASSLAKQLDVPVVLSKIGLEEAGVAADVLLAGNYDRVPRLAMYRDLLEEHNLDIVVLDEAILITSEEMAAEHPDTCIYPVHDLVEQNSNYPDDIASNISSLAAPDSWVDNGGGASISSLRIPSVLVINQTNSAHMEIEHVLTSLRAAGAAEQVKKEAEADEEIIQRVYPLYVARRELKVRLALEEDEEKAKTDDKANKNVKPQFGSIDPVGRVSHAKAYVTEPIPTADEVAELLRETLTGVSWKEEGVLLKPFHDVLIIRHKRSTLRKIEAFLDSIDAWHSSQIHGLGGVAPEAVRGGGGFF